MSNALRRRGKRPRLRFEPLEPRALLAVAGSLDPTFGAGYGFSTVPLGVPTQSTGAPTVQAESVATLPDGKIAVSATMTTNSTSALAIEELNPDGSLDTSFGTGGLAVVQVSYGAKFTMAVQSNGQIIEASSSSTADRFLAFRLNANGTLDTTFGTNGFAAYPANTTTPLTEQLGDVATILPLPGGQILLAGNAYDPRLGFTTVELNADGSIDTSYGTAGTSNSQVVGNGFVYTTSSAVLQSNGQVVLAGTIGVPTPNTLPVVFWSESAVVFRLNTDGSLDTTFAGGAGGGIAVLPIDPSDPSDTGGFNGALNLAVQPTTGDLLVEGAVSSYSESVGGVPPSLVIDYYTLYGLNPDGTLDTSFGTNGQALPALPGFYGEVSLSAMAVQANGDILLSGTADNFFNQDFENVVLLRLGPGGSPDATFGNTSTPGLLLTQLISSEPDVAIQPVNNDIIAFGVSTINALSGQTYGLTVDSILPVANTGPAATPPPPSPPANLLGLGTTNLAVYDPTTGSFVYSSATNTGDTSAPPGNDTFPFGIAGAGQTIPAVADYLGLGYDQVGVYLTASGTYAILPTATSPGLFQQFGMAGAGNSIPVPADYYGTGQADVAVYMPSIASFAIMAVDGQPGRIIPFGIPGAGQSIPAPADYFNTGQDDIAVYLAQAGAFAILTPDGASGEVIPFGKPGLGQSIPVPGDYDGSGKTELAVYIPSLGAYFYRPANGGADVEVPVGTANSGEIPVPGDYDGSGRTEAAIYDPTGGFIEYQPANGGPEVINYIGTANNGSIPVAAPAGALPEFAAPGSGSGSAIRPGAIVPSSAASGSSGSTNAITLSTTSAVPAGPTLASVRVARSLVNQAAPDPLKLV